MLNSKYLLNIPQCIMFVGNGGENNNMENNVICFPFYIQTVE